MSEGFEAEMGMGGGGEVMIGGGEGNEVSLRGEWVEGDKEVVWLVDGGGEVVLGVKDEEGGGEILEVREGGVVAEVV
ncbi:hypothetical protein, partial [Paenibacillus sp. Y412MC10]|uniref:hypothetical protein n=1 Tax=Geobacillus sp. (strain Y412MC10) TaxID=481743 RepID=UPI0011A0329F